MNVDIDLWFQEFIEGTADTLLRERVEDAAYWKYETLSRPTHKEPFFLYISYSDRSLDRITITMKEVMERILNPKSWGE